MWGWTKIGSLTGKMGLNGLKLVHFKKKIPEQREKEWKFEKFSFGMGLTIGKV